MKSEIVHIGVDVSKEKLDVYNPITGEVSELPNDAAGFREVRAMARRGKAVVCCEPTGGYELDMVLFFQRRLSSRCARSFFASVRTGVQSANCAIMRASTLSFFESCPAESA